MLSTFDKKGATKPLSLDEILAFSVPEFKNEYELVRQNLSNFIDHPGITGTSLETDVLPTAKDLLTWFRFFPESMQECDKRLSGSIKLRICYAERGMSLIITLLKAVQKEINILKKEQVEKEQAQSLLLEMLEMTENVLGCKRRNGLTFMRNWLSTLVDTVPLEYRTYNSTLTEKNVKTLDVFCENISLLK